MVSLVVGVVIGVVLFAIVNALTSSRPVVEPLVPPPSDAPPMERRPVQGKRERPREQRPPASPVTDQRVVALVSAGKTIDAIKLQRELTGDGLKDAKDAVEAVKSPVAAVRPPQQRELFTAAQLDGALLPLLREGRKIEAIKLLREKTGLGLRESKDHIDALEAKAAAKGPVATVRPPPPREIVRPGKIAPEQLDEALLPLLREGRKIEAIKLHREQTGLGLRESKNYADALAARGR
jgi:ribosomal protein L7/L12